VVQCKILIVDDFEPFRRFLCALLQREPRFQVIGQASDGLEAVERTKELQPDLILLDVGLPRLNGIEAGRRIRNLCPSARILFISHESSAELVEETLRLGAHGYIHKSRILSDLLLAIERVLVGQQFVSGGLEISQDARTVVRPRHEVQFYCADWVLVESFGRFVTGALKVGNAAIVIATESHRESLIDRLNREGLDINALIQQGTYISADASEMFSTIMVNGSPDCLRFFESLCSLVQAALKTTKAEHPRVAICGEYAELLHPEGDISAVLSLERTGNHLAQSHHVDIMCAYPVNGFRNQQDDESFKSICAEHTAVHFR